MTRSEKPLQGCRILVPRGGAWGSIVATALREQGAISKIAPLIDFSHTSDEEKLRSALEQLTTGYFDWVTATNATVVDVINHHGAKIPSETKIAVAGEATFAAFVESGYQVTLTTDPSDNSVSGLLNVWPEINEPGNSLKVLTLRSDVAKPVLSEGLLARGHDVTQVIAYRTVGVPASLMVREDVESGHINVLLVTSPQVAREVFVQFRDIPKGTEIVFVGDGARIEAERLGLSRGTSALSAKIASFVMSVVDPADLVD